MNASKSEFTEARVAPAANVHGRRMLSIREFRRDDEDEVIGLWERCGLVKPQNDPRKDIRRKAKVRPDLFRVGEIEGKIVASIMIGYEGHRGWINYLAVDPSHQKRSFGRQMMDEAERLLRAEDCPKINLLVRTSNADVLAFYHAIGYARDDVVSMGKRLEHDDTGQREEIGTPLAPADDVARTDEITIRPAEPADLADINAIYNYYVAHSTCVWGTQPCSESERKKWYDEHGQTMPVLVAEFKGRIVGWAALGSFRAAYTAAGTLDDSIYVHHDFHRRKIGSRLLAALIEAARRTGVRSILANISADQTPSIRLHEKFGFQKAAHLRDVGQKYDKRFDAVYLQLLLAR